MPRFKFNGIYAASLTPLHADLTCDYDAYADHCKDLIAQGCSGVVLFGTTGEGLFLQCCRASRRHSSDR